MRSKPSRFAGISSGLEMTSGYIFVTAERQNDLTHVSKRNSLTRPKKMDQNGDGASTTPTPDAPESLAHTAPVTSVLQ